MADSTVRTEDLVPVRSRVSWGAIAAGAVVAMAIYLVLTLLCGAVGLSVRDNVRTETLGTMAALAAIFTTVVALFAGGWVASQCTVGENQTEAMIYGVVVWGLVLFSMASLVGAGMRAGFSAMWGMASFTSTAAQNTTSQDWEAAARTAGVPQETINDWRTKATNVPATARAAAEDPANREAAAEYTTRATWYTLMGTLLSMLSAVAGAVVGSGPNFRLIALNGMATRTTYERAQLAGRT